MCEFCSNPNQQLLPLEFSGYFSANAIEEAVRQAQSQRKQEGGYDTDGT